MKPTDLIKDIFPGAVVGGWKRGKMSDREIRQAEERGFAMVDNIDTVDIVDTLTSVDNGRLS